MASSSNHLNPSLSSQRRTTPPPQRRKYSPSIFRLGHSSSKSRSAFSGYPINKIIACRSESGRKQLEIVYDPDERLNRLADEVDKNTKLSRLTLFSPCKINVFLRITGKRDDGFHDLASLFHVISLGDTIKFSLSPSKNKDRLSTNVPGVPVDGRNLIIRALNLYRKKTGTNNFFWIHLDKKVPTGAGLGGGSSNAATALWAANQFSGCLVTEKELQQWSGEIGSDIPFFFSNGAAYCTGRGEIQDHNGVPQSNLELFLRVHRKNKGNGEFVDVKFKKVVVVQDLPHALLKDLPMVLIKPPEACSTAEVYKRLLLDKTSSIDPLALLEKISLTGISQDVCINDLETPAFKVLPSLKKLKQRMLAAGRGQYSAVFMSGSGSTIVGIGSPDPPQFVYAEDDDHKDLFISDASFLTRQENLWYAEPASSSSFGVEEMEQQGNTNNV